MFSSLRIKEFRLYWSAMLVSLVGSWIHVTAQSWLVYSLTRSPFLMGLVGFLASLPVVIFSVPAGALADRVPKRNLIMIAQVMMALLAFVLAWLVFSQKIHVWQVMVIACGQGLAMAFDAPTRQAMVVDLVGKNHLLNAIALNSAVFNFARVLGPALAAVMIAVSGLAGCFFVNAISFLPFIAILSRLRPKPVSPDAGSRAIFTDIKDGLRVIRQDQHVIFLFGVTAFVSVFGASYAMLMPIFAQDIFQSGSRGLAYLMTASGFGAVIGTLNVARLSKSADLFKVLRNLVLICFSALMGFAWSRSFPVSMALLVLVGFGGASAMSLVNTLLQARVPDAYRGRIMGVYMLVFGGLVPFGNLIAGTLAHFWGAPAVVFWGALASLASLFIMEHRY